MHTAGSSGWPGGRGAETHVEQQPSQLPRKPSQRRCRARPAAWAARGWTPGRRRRCSASQKSGPSWTICPPFVALPPAAASDSVTDACDAAAGNASVSATTTTHTSPVRVAPAPGLHEDAPHVPLCVVNDGQHSRRPFRHGNLGVRAAHVCPDPPWAEPVHLRGARQGARMTGLPRRQNRRPGAQCCWATHTVIPRCFTAGSAAMMRVARLSSALLTCGHKAAGPVAGVRAGRSGGRKGSGLLARLVRCGNGDLAHVRIPRVEAGRRREAEDIVQGLRALDRLRRPARGA